MHFGHKPNNTSTASSTIHMGATIQFSSSLHELRTHNRTPQDSGPSRNYFISTPSTPSRPGTPGLTQDPHSLLLTCYVPLPGEKEQSSKVKRRATIKSAKNSYIHHWNNYKSVFEQQHPAVNKNKRHPAVSKNGATRSTSVSGLLSRMLPLGYLVDRIF